jgi:hypothetical protein
MFCRFCFICLFFLLSCFSLRSQWFFLRSDHLVAGLKSQGVDSVIIFYSSCHGNCIGILAEYLIWKENGKLYSQKLDFGFDSTGWYKLTRLSSVVRIDSTTIYDFLEAHFDDIFESTVIPAVTKRLFQEIESYEVPQVHHYMEYTFSISIGEQEKSKTINAEYVRKEFGLGRKNLNYEYNLSTSVGKFFDLLNSQVEQLEEKKLYAF